MLRTRLIRVSTGECIPVIQTARMLTLERLAAALPGHAGWYQLVVVFKGPGQLVRWVEAAVEEDARVEVAAEERV